MLLKDGARLHIEKQHVSRADARSPSHDSFAFSAMKPKGIGEHVHMKTPI